MDRIIPTVFHRRALAALLAFAMLALGAAVPHSAAAQSFSMENVYLCRDYNYKGTCLAVRVQMEASLIPDLGTTVVGNRSVSSVWNGSGQSVVLFRGSNFTGQCDVIKNPLHIEFESDPYLSDNGSNRFEVPDDKAMSAIVGGWNHYRMIYCPEPVLLCEHPNFAGTCMNVSRSIANLSGTILANDTLSSLLVKPGTKVALYEHANFEGTCETFTASDTALSDNIVGDDRVSSMWLGHSCDEDIQLCEHSGLRGRCVSFRRDVPYLGYNAIGNDVASSIRVPAGAKVTVYSDSNYLGWIDTFTGPVTKDFGWGTYAPNDSASSIWIQTLPTGSNPCSGSFGCLTAL